MLRRPEAPAFRRGEHLSRGVDTGPPIGQTHGPTSASAQFHSSQFVLDFTTTRTEIAVLRADREFAYGGAGRAECMAASPSGPASTGCVLASCSAAARHVRSAHFETGAPRPAPDPRTGGTSTAALRARRSPAAAIPESMSRAASRECPPRAWASSTIRLSQRSPRLVRRTAPSVGYAPARPVDLPSAPEDEARRTRAVERRW
jgi:hypothetical protein